MPRKHKPSMSKAERELAHAFHTSVRGRPCVGCHRAAEEAHHVVDKNYLKRLGKPPAMIWDVRAAVPVCSWCHGRHTNAYRRLPIEGLTKANRDFTREALEAQAGDYLTKRYRPSTTPV